MILRAAVAASVVLAVACGTGGGEGARCRERFCVGLLTPGPIGDRSWNGEAYRGLLGIRDSMGGHVSHVQIRTPADIEENLREYGARGYRLVIGHGYEFQDIVMRVAPDYPRTVYAITGGRVSAANVVSMRFGVAAVAFEAGRLAGNATRSGVVGMIGGTELPPVKEVFEAFARGVVDARAGARVLTAYVGNWDDVGTGKELALAQIARGVDVIFQDADAAGLGVFQAVRERRGVWVIGTNADQNGIAPEVTLASVVIDLPAAFLMVAGEARERGFAGKVMEFDVGSGIVRLVINPRMESIRGRSDR